MDHGASPEIERVRSAIGGRESNSHDDRGARVSVKKFNGLSRTRPRFRRKQRTNAVSFAPERNEKKEA